jgi:hypothetical protein
MRLKGGGDLRNETERRENSGMRLKGGIDLRNESERRERPQE